jgi:hypothetical protein
MSNETTYAPRIYGANPTQPSPIDSKYHYVYRITNTVTNKHYYGSRTSNVHPFNDLGIWYRSSSTDESFRKDQINNPEKYTYKVVQCFDERSKAYDLEVKLHRIFNVAFNESFYNLANQTSSGFISIITGKLWYHNPEAKISGRFSPDDVIPEGWVKGRGAKWYFDSHNRQVSLVDINSAKDELEANPGFIKGMNFWHNPVTKEYRKFYPDDEIPKGWIVGMGVDFSWYSDPITKQTRRIFSGETAPEGWVSGRLDLNGEWWHNPATKERAIINSEPPEGWVRGMGVDSFEWWHNPVTKETGKFYEDAPEGWVRGTGPSGLKKYHNPNTLESRMFSEDDIIPEGWVQGQGAISNWFYNPETNESTKFYPDEEVPEGWVPGRSISGTYYTDPISLECRLFTDLEEVPDGWVKGRKNFTSKVKGTSYVSNHITNEELRVKSSEIQSYLDQGWVKGRLPKKGRSLTHSK